VNQGFVGWSVAPRAQGGLIEKITVTGAVRASILFDRIPQVYSDLSLVVVARSDTAANGTNLQAQFNGDTSAIYNWQRLDALAASTSADEHFSQTSAVLMNIAAANGTAGYPGQALAWFPGYAGAVFNKGFSSMGMVNINNSTQGCQLLTYCGLWRSTAAIQSMLLTPAAGSFIIGSEFRLYGNP